jgi:hypothetical protein
MVQQVEGTTIALGCSLTRKGRDNNGGRGGNMGGCLWRWFICGGRLSFTLPRLAFSFFILAYVIPNRIIIK